MKKKFIVGASIIATSCLFFTACDNSSRTMAKNLEDTVTNLIYSVSSLDWADSDILSNLTESNSSSNNSNSVFLASNRYAVKNNYNYQDNVYTIEQNETEETENDKMINNNYENNLENENTIPEYDEALDIENAPPLPKPPHYDRPPTQNNRERRLPIRYNKHKHRNRHMNHKDLDYPNDVEQNSELSEQTTSHNLRNATSNSSKISSSISPVSYSTATIEESNYAIQDSISNLISSRSSLLLYINDLYNGTIKLTNDDATAINAYINIIKDNTSYLNQNKGIITNQLSQANNIASTNASSPLINAYIIRTNEAMETRIAKLESSISAIDAICSILKSKTVNNNANNTTSQTQPQALIKNSTINNNLSTNNKNANNPISNTNNNNITPQNSQNIALNDNNDIESTKSNNNSNTVNKNQNIIDRNIINKTTDTKLNTTNTINPSQKNANLTPATQNINEINETYNNLQNQGKIINDNVLNGLYGNNTMANSQSRNAINNIQSTTEYNCESCPTCPDCTPTQNYRFSNNVSLNNIEQVAEKEEPIVEDKNGSGEPETTAQSNNLPLQESTADNNHESTDNKLNINNDKLLEEKPIEIESLDNNNSIETKPLKTNNLLMSFINPKHADKYKARNTSSGGYVIDNHSVIKHTPYKTNIA